MNDAKTSSSGTHKCQGRDNSNTRCRDLEAGEERLERDLRCQKSALYGVQGQFINDMI
jgi:hypothetical protein